MEGRSDLLEGLEGARAKTASSWTSVWGVQWSMLGTGHACKQKIPRPILHLEFLLCETRMSLSPAAMSQVFHMSQLGAGVVEGSRQHRAEKTEENSFQRGTWSKKGPWDRAS